MATSSPPPNTLRHRKAFSEPSSSSSTTIPLADCAATDTDATATLMDASSAASRHVQVTATALSLTSLLTTLTTTGGITTTARKLYSYPTKRLSGRKYKNDDDALTIDGGRRSACSSTSTSGASTPPPYYDEEARTITISPPARSSIVPLHMPVASNSANEDAGVVSAKFAMQGHNLLSLSLAEPPSSTFRRHLYVDSLTYLLRALPADLSTSEAAQLVASLPPSLQSYFHQQDLSTTNGMEGMNVHIPPSCKPEHPTIHYLLAVVTAATVASVRHLAPHVKTLARSTWEYNVKYRVAERGIDAMRGAFDSGFAFWKMVAQWVMTEDEVGEKGVVRSRRYGAGIVRDVGNYAGGVVRSGVGGVVEGFVEGLK
ncbi:hypothetical protein ABW21_db0204105 [Orbilia brochopaga]|nr:hypothetical protein ABW21_db0204105 [Drechslerella brochopaga]